MHRSCGAELELWEAQGAAPLWTCFSWGWALCWTADGGSVEYAYGGERFRLGPGVVLAVAPADVPPVAIDARDFNVLVVDRRAEDGGPPRELEELAPLGPLDGGALHGCLDSVRAALAAKSREVRALLRETLRTLRTEARRATPRRRAVVPHRALRLARAYLEAHLEQRISLEEVAAVAGMSKYYLAREFRRVYGLPPQRFLRRLRAARALALLREGATPTDVAAQVGFADQPHLTRVLREEVGVTPARYLRGG